MKTELRRNHGRRHCCSFFTPLFPFPHCELQLTPAITSVVWSAEVLRSVEANISKISLRICVHTSLVRVCCRVPCEFGTCSSPLDIVTIELYAYNRFPHPVIAALCWPGAFFSAASDLDTRTVDTWIPDWDTLLHKHVANVTLRDPAVTLGGAVPLSWEEFKSDDMDLKLGCFLSVLGAVGSLYLGPTIMTSIGTALLMLHCYRVAHDSGLETFEPSFWLALLASWAWIRWDWVLNYLDSWLYQSQTSKNKAGTSSDVNAESIEDSENVLDTSNRSESASKVVLKNEKRSKGAGKGRSKQRKL